MAQADIEPLSWDSNHYGRPVARIGARALDHEALAAILGRARREGVWLLYWFSDVDAKIDPELLARYAGLSVGGHVRYARAVESDHGAQPLAPAGVSLGSEHGSAPERALRELAIAASALSRFRVDARLPAHKCDEMYEIWLARSLSGELATEVLVARRGASPVGLVTLRVRGPVAELGLVSTDERERGRGVASSLVRLAHERCRALGAARLEVVTQPENQAACALYERAGFQRADVGSFHHFLPSEAEPRAS